MFLLIVFAPCFSHAADLGLEQDFQRSFQHQKDVVKKAKEKQKKGQSVHEEIALLKSKADELRTSHLLLYEKFKAREDEIKGLGAKAINRHKEMMETYADTVEEYLSMIDSLPPGGKVKSKDLDLLNEFLDKHVHKRKLPLLGALPYRHLNYPSREPNASPSIKPAYKGGNKTVSPDDTKSTESIPISKEIAEFAQSLNWQPVAIYEYMKADIDTEWAWGCRKSIEETLRQKSGTPCEQSALFAAALRSAGFPSRIIRGTIEFPYLEHAKNLTGIDDPSKIAEFFQKAGIPYKPIIAGGKITNFQIEHVWLESLIPYSNYRGAIIDEHGKTWLGLDTSIKVTGYTYNAPLDIFQELSFDGLRDEYLDAVRTETPLEYMKTYIETYLNQNHPGTTYNDLLQTKTLMPEVMNILPASMQYDQITVTHEYTDIPDDLKHKVKFTASDTNNNELFSISIDSLQLSNRKITLSYEPETVEDQQIIDSYGGLDNTPAYLVRLRPALMVNGDMVVAGKDGLPAGTDYDLTLELVSPNGTERITNTQITGNLSSIGIVAGKAIIPETVPEEEKDAETILHEETISYIDRWNKTEDELASLLHLTFTRPIPTVTTIGGVIDVTYLLDVPHGFEWKGVYLDASLRSASLVQSSKSEVQSERQKTFMQLSALQGSILENRVFEDDWQVEFISTAKMMQIVDTMQPAPEIITVDKTNLNDILPTLLFDDEIKEDISNAVNQNLTVRIPNQEITYKDWTGIGYIKENSGTGEAGYMLSGLIAGGMTVWGIDKWPTYYRDRLKNPYIEPPNYDPASARYIQKLATTDVQFGEAGSLLGTPLMVKVTDQKGKAVAKAEVVFKVKAGGGKLMNPGENDVISAWTDDSGIARIYFRLGKETKTNPAFFFLDAIKDIYPTQVGENIIEASLGTNGATTPKPFTEYGKPGKPTQIVQTHGDGTWGLILSFAGFVSVVMKDSNNNPIANLPISFQALAAQANNDLPNCSKRYFDTKNGTLLTTTGDPCIKKAPIYGECTDASSVIDKILTTSAGTAMAEVILGGTPDAIYPITALCTDTKCSNLSTTFNLYTYYFDDCSLTDAPKAQLFATYVYTADPFGNNIDAGSTGTIIPVQARLYYLKEGTSEADETLSCGGSTLICKKIVGDRSYSAGSDFVSPSATFAGVQGVSKGNGIFASTYKLAAGLNEIQIKGNGAITDIRSHNNCTDGCKPPSKDTITLGEGMTIMKVYGVDIALKTFGNVYTDKDGYSYNDFKLDYTITPAEYIPMSEAVVLYKDSEMIDYISSDIGSTGTATLAKGYQFDIGSKYEAEVVLNFGSGVEIRGGKITLPVGQFKMVADDDGLTQMQGAVTDGAARLRLQLTVKYNKEAFAGLTWQLIDPQVMDYTPSSIRGGFVSGGAVVDSLPVTFNADGVAEAVYRSPESFVRWDTLEASNDKERQERLIQPTVDLANYFKTLKDPLPPIRLKRPPVVLVHGLWGSAKAWDVFEPKFNDKGLYENQNKIYRVNYYEKGQVRSIVEHAPELESTIEDAIGRAKKKLFAVSKVDVIAHSMGGLLTREYCQQFNAECQKRIRRFVSIATPHTGSELADLLLVYRDDPDNFPNQSACKKTVEKLVRGDKIRLVSFLGFTELIKVSPHPIGPRKSADNPSGSAIDDLATGALPPFINSSTSKGRWQNYSPLSETLSSHAIVGITPGGVDGYHLEIWGLWQLVLRRCGFTPENVFGDSSDRIVRKLSQRDGLDNGNITEFLGTDHFTVRNWPDAIDRIKLLLDVAVTSGLFSQ